MEEKLSLTDFVHENYTKDKRPEYQGYVDYFLNKHGDSILAVVLYGSCVSNSTRSETSMPDFYLIVDDYRRFHKRRFQAYINAKLPPVVFNIDSDSNGLPGKCKYCVISEKDLEVHTSLDAKDLYHLGRFSKKVSILYTKMVSDGFPIVEAAIRSWENLADHALCVTQSEFRVEHFAKSLLGLSYLGEVRLEKTQDKVSALYEANQEFYDHCFSQILLSHSRSHRDEFIFDETLADGTYLQRRTPVKRVRQRQFLNKLLAKSRRRGKMRWAFMIFTVDNWVDILLAKVERTYGVKIELTEKERKHPLIFGWKYYFKFKREGKIK